MFIAARTTSSLSPVGTICVRQRHITYRPYGTEEELNIFLKTYRPYGTKENT